MKYSLLLDTSNKLLVVGLAKNDEVIDSIIYECFQRQSEFMILKIEEILKRNNVEPKEVGEIVVTLGPGSYTGIRIALTIAKIYSYTLNIPLYAISSLYILKDKNNPSICLMNARSKRSYIGVYENNKVLLKDQVMKNEDVIEYIASHKDYKVCGDIEYLFDSNFNLENNKDEIVLNPDLLNNMLEGKTLENSRVENILSLKAIYLKD